MDKSLIKRLLQLCHNNEGLFRASPSLSAFFNDFHIGYQKGRLWDISNEDKAKIKGILFHMEGIDADKNNDWNGLSRSESLRHGFNEKLTSQKVRLNRVAIKALPGLPLRMNTDIDLPNGANLDVSWSIVAQESKASSILVIENWEVFESIHQVNFALECAKNNPLVIFRGSPVYQTHHTQALLHALQLPVFAFMDFDPSGLVLAQSMPYFHALVSPPLDVLEKALQTAGNYARFQGQLHQASHVLERSSYDDIQTHWRLLKKYAVALPHEYFLLNPA